MDEDRLVKKKRRAKRVGNFQQLAEVVKELGDLYFETGRVQEALDEYLEQLELCNTLNDKLNGAVAHRMMGEIYVILGDYEQALMHQNQHLERAKEIENLLEEQRAFATLGRTYFCLAENLPEGSKKKNEALANAKKAYAKSIRLCNELEKTDIELKEIITMRARLLLNLGLVLDVQKEQGQAIDLMENAATLCKEHNLREDFHRTQIALAGFYERQANCELALDCLEKATNIDNLSLKSEARLAKAELLLRMERWLESRKVLVSLYVTSGLPQSLRCQIEKSLRIVATLQQTEQLLNAEDDASRKLQLYEVLGDAAVAAHSLNKAISYYTGMLSCAEECKSDRTSAALISLAQTLKDAGRYSEALDFARQELKLCKDPRETSRSALFLADLLITTEAADKEIREFYDLALTNAKACDTVSLEISVIKELVSYLENSGLTEERETLEEQFAVLKSSLVSAESEDESEEEEIGGNICLDDLSDVEKELKAAENVRMTRRRTGKRGLAVKKNEKGETQLHVACISGNVENVEKLLSVGHPVNVRDHFGWTPLHEAANHGHVEIAKLLLESGAEVNDSGGIMCQGVTPLHDAGSCGNLSMMRLLIDHGANVILRTAEGDTALDSLEQWRSRVEDLSPADQADYEEIHKSLSVVLPPSTKNRRSTNKLPTSLIDDETSGEENIVERISAGEDYKRTIASLKHREDPIKVLPTHTRSVVGPLLDSEQDIVDDWLEDDVGEVTGKRIKTNFPNACKRKSTTSHVSYENSTKRQKTNSRTETENLISSGSEESRDSCINETTIVSERKSVKSKRQQVSLLTIGFTRDSLSPLPISSDANHSDFESRDFESAIEAAIILNIHVDGQVFKIQTDLARETTLLMKDIVSNVEEKFYCETGCKASFCLKTMSDTTIQSNNILKILKGSQTCRRNLKCEIIQLQIPSIIERYSTVCKTYNTVVREFVSKCLKSCENTSILRLKQEDVTNEELLMVLKTLEYQKTIQILHLSGGELHEAGELLNNCITRLSTLQELYLPECDIDLKCLSQFGNLPPLLKLLDLSYNPLASATHVLCKLLKPLKQLQSLNLRYCQLDEFEFPVSNGSLVNLDISWNNLSESGPCCLLQRQLLNLNLSNTIFESQSMLVASVVNNSNFSFTSLESLDLSSCNISDSDVENVLSLALNLARFVLSGNKRVTILSANMLLKHRPTLRYIDISGCTHLTEEPDPELFIDNPKLCTFVASMVPEICQSWLILWRGAGVKTSLPHYLTIFKPSERIER